MAAIAVKRVEVIDQFGGDVSAIQRDLIGDYARVDTLIETVWRNIELGGVVTPKGKKRAAVGMLLSLLDRRQRLAVLLGLERRSKHVDLAQAFAQQERERG